MPRRSMLGNVTQLRVEATLGTDPGTGTKVLRSMGVNLRPDGTVSTFQPASGLFPTQVAVGTEFATGELPDATVLADEIIYPLSSLIAPATISTPGGGTTSRQWVFDMPTAGGATPKSFTVESGNSGAGMAEKVSGFVVNEYHVNLTRAACAAGGAGFGQLWQMAQTLTGSPTTLPQVQMLPNRFDAYVDATWGGLGTTQLTACFQANWSLTNRWGRIWPINSALASWDGVTETEPTARLALSVENNAAGQAFVSALRAGTTKYVRVKAATAGFIEAAIPWSYQLDYVGKVLEFPNPGDTDGLMVLPITFAAINDGTNPPFRITVVNTTTAL